ncbi:MAG: hypothetical protein QG639_1135 [Patescibacteria group bacterium]|nr:hypothetical protein [Patescibacteria group bacterium]
MKVIKKIKELCPVAITLETVGGKWKLVILWHLSRGTHRFSELERKIEGITQKMLTQELREMEKDGLVFRKVYPVVPPKVEYSLTDHGKSLNSVLDSLSSWGERHQQLK